MAIKYNTTWASTDRKCFLLKLIRLINSYFLEDPAHNTDYLFYYSFIGLATMILFFSIVLNDLKKIYDLMLHL